MMSCPGGAQQQTRRTPQLLSNDGTDRQTDGRTDGRPTVTQRRYSAYNEGNVNKLTDAITAQQAARNSSPLIVMRVLSAISR